MDTFVRFMLYLIKRFTAVVVVIILIIFAAFMGYDYANIYVIVSDGIEERAKVVLMESDYTTLSKFYTYEYLEKDSLLSNNPYSSYIVTNYDLRVKIKKIRVWPWNNEAKVVVEEVINPINAVPKDSKKENLSVPEWENGIKQVIMKKNGRWRIDDIIVLETIKTNENDD